MNALYHSPIVRAFVVFAVMLAVSLSFLPLVGVNDILDSFAMSGGVAVMVRFGPAALAGLRMQNPDAPAIWIVSGAGIALSIALIRLLRQIGIEFGIIQSVVVGSLFEAITILMVFCLYLQVIAPPFKGGTVQYSPWAALLAALCGGLLVVAFVMALRHIF